MALEEASRGNCRDDEMRQERCWKLFMLLPRMLLHKSGFRAYSSKGVDKVGQNAIWCSGVVLKSTAGAAKAFPPTALGYVVPTHLFRELLLEKLQLPLPVGRGGVLWLPQSSGATCGRSGVERMLVRVCYKGGTRVRYNAFLRDMTVLEPQEARSRPPLSRRGAVKLWEPHPNAVDVDGVVQARARANTEETYPELLTGRCPGGRWSSEAMDFVRQLAFAKAREVPSHMRFPIALVWERRWTRKLSTACSLAFASLVEPSDKCATWCWTGEPPSLAELFGQDPQWHARAHVFVVD